jgi:pimeloyl-ACP methyl ester carboxylesterase
MVQRRPDLFAAYVGTGQMNSLEDDGRDLYSAAMARAKARSDSRAIASLESVASLPFTNVRRMDVVHKWGKTEDMSDSPLLVLIAPFISPGYPMSKAFSVAEGFESSRKALFPEELQICLERDVPELKTPAFLFQGKYDWQVSTAAAVRYFKRLHAPAKEIVLFEGGHFVHVFHSDAFLSALTAKVRPLAQGRGSQLGPHASVPGAAPPNKGDINHAAPSDAFCAPHSQQKLPPPSSWAARRL